MLKWIKRTLLVLVILVATISGWKFSFDNGEPVQLLLLGSQLPTMPIGLWILSALLLGCVLGFILSYLPNALNQYSLQTKSRKIQRLEKKLQKVPKGLKG